ncbi:hypothetical protein NDI76_03455 [Halogeometricum sp. S1BR25-6]|uniref:Uncharacterized protein n=1 Tax=Halogeometricum salsisoli TaxID=2950536 RepID=A0ABU2GC77_9EURY|nr:hypothetical protein [Halogeometricum sp. S1BR25-6]MDS0297789.1 hypothetical protein [Halogeometricum sp. S1BR25-6]
MNDGHRGLSYYVVLAASIILITFLSYVLYQTYIEKGLTLQFASVLSSATLVVITIWYAQSTHKLLSKTEKQTEATQAAYAPKLDIKQIWAEDSMELIIANRGLGVARDISIKVDVYPDVGGFDSIGERYQYILHFQQSLPPNQKFTTDSGDSIVVEPRFFTELSDTTIQEYIRRSGDHSQEALVDSGIINEDTYEYLMDYYEKEGKGGSESLPVETGTIFGLTEIVDRKKLPGQPPLIVDVTANYRDIVGTTTYSEKLVDGHGVLTEMNRSGKRINAFRSAPPVSGVKIRIWNSVMDFLRERMPEINITYPYEEDYDASLKDI